MSTEKNSSLYYTILSREKAGTSLEATTGRSRSVLKGCESLTWCARSGDDGSGVRRLAHLSVTGQVPAVSVLQPQAMLLGMLGEDAVEQTSACAAGGRRAGGSRLHFHAREPQLFLLAGVVRLDFPGIHCNSDNETSFKWTRADPKRVAIAPCDRPCAPSIYPGSGRIMS